MLNASLADEGIKYEDSMPKPSICSHRYYNVQQDETVYSVTTRRIPGSAAAFTFPAERFRRAPGPDSKKAAHTGVWRPCRTVRPDTSFLGRHDHPATWAFAPPARSSRTERAAQVSGAHLLNLSLTESLISEAFSLVLSHIELSDEEPSLVMVSVGWAGVVPFMDAPSVEPCS